MPLKLSFRAIVQTAETLTHATRFAWHVVQADGTTLPDGLDLAFVSPDGAKI
jgi:hypothetical protein